MNFHHHLCMFEWVGVFFFTCGLMSLFSFYCLFLWAFFSCLPKIKKRLYNHSCKNAINLLLQLSDEQQPIRRLPVLVPFESFFVHLLVPLVRLVWAEISQFGSKWPSVAELQKDSLLISQTSLPLTHSPFVSALRSDWPVKSEALSLSGVMWCDCNHQRLVLLFCWSHFGLFRPKFQF